MKIKKAVIILGYNCNNNCIFCISGKKRTLNKQSLDQIKKQIFAKKESGSTYLELIGGEPTIRKDIFEIVSFAKTCGYETIMLATNGRMFSNLSFTKKIIKSGLNKIIFSIHASNSKLHDTLTQVPGSFNQLLEGIKNLRSIGFDNIGTNSTIVKQNYHELPELGKFLVNLGIKTSEFIFVDPSKGFLEKRYYEIVPTYSDVSKNVNLLLEIGHSNNINHWLIRYYPLCFIDEKYHSNVAETWEKKFFSKTSHYAPDYSTNDAQRSRININKKKILKCHSCKYTESCEGFWAEYVKKSMLSEIRIEITYDCNKNCSFCYNNNIDTHNDSNFSFGDFQILLNKIINGGIQSIRFTGGEPTKHPMFEKFVRLSIDKGLKVIVNTNGLLFEKFDDSFIRLIDKVIISANETDDINKILSISKRREKLYINTVLTNENINNLEIYYESFDKHEFINWSLLRYIPNDISKELDIESVKNLFYKLEKFDKTIYIDNHFPFCCLDPNVTKKYIRENGVCNGKNTILLSPYGKFRVCNSLSDEIGDLNSDLINDVWENGFLYDLKNLKYSPIECKNCKYLLSCNSGCRYMAKLNQGSYKTLDPLANPNNVK